MKTECHLLLFTAAPFSDIHLRARIIEDKIDNDENWKHIYYRERGGDCQRNNTLVRRSLHDIPSIVLQLYIWTD